MADMRLIVAGAGGRMGRALTRVISETPGAVLTGALEAPGSALLGKDAGMLAGLPENGVKLSADLWTLSADADGILDFTVPAATIAALKERGHGIEAFLPWTMKVGGIQAIAVDPATGVMTGAADPRRDGYAVAL